MNTAFHKFYKSLTWIIVKRFRFDGAILSFHDHIAQKNYIEAAHLRLENHSLLRTYYFRFYFYCKKYKILVHCSKRYDSGKNYECFLRNVFQKKNTTYNAMIQNTLGIYEMRMSLTFRNSLDVRLISVITRVLPTF